MARASHWALRAQRQYASKNDIQRARKINPFQLQAIRYKGVILPTMQRISIGRCQIRRRLDRFRDQVCRSAGIGRRVHLLSDTQRNAKGSVAVTVHAARNLDRQAIRTSSHRLAPAQAVIAKSKVDCRRFLTPFLRVVLLETQLGNRSMSGLRWPARSE